MNDKITMYNITKSSVNMNMLVKNKNYPLNNTQSKINWNL